MFPQQGCRSQLFTAGGSIKITFIHPFVSDEGGAASSRCWLACVALLPLHFVFTLRFTPRRSSDACWHGDHNK